MTGHKTETVYWHYAIVDETMMHDAAEQLAALHEEADQHRAARSNKKKVSNLCGIVLT